MNIFNVLSMGKSRLHETGMSAMFAYLLNPNEDHGLGKIFLDSFLKESNNNGLYTDYIENTTLKFQIDLEVSYHDNGRNDIDIQIKILDNDYKELHRIIIENKIKSGAANPSQLSRYYNAVLNDEDNDDAFELDPDQLSVIFLTPKLNHKGLDTEFKNLDISNKTRMYWNSHDDEITIVKLIQNILLLEQKADISPINEYMRHTLKAFTFFINRTITLNNGGNRRGENIGDIKEQKEIKIEEKSYTIIMRDSGQIQLLNDSGDKINARARLVKYSKEKGLFADGNTRQLGKRIFEKIK